MFRSFALYASLRARHSQTPTSAVRSTPQAMLTAAQGTSQPLSNDAMHQLQQLPAVQHSSLTCFTARLLGAAISLHLAQAHAYSTAIHGTTLPPQAADQGQASLRAVQARCMHTGKQLSSCRLLTALVQQSCTSSSEHAQETVLFQMPASSTTPVWQCVLCSACQHSCRQALCVLLVHGTLVTAIW